jgi:hypothetical protein
MNYIIIALAVYKIIQLFDSLLPKDVMPWVKIVGSLVLSYVGCVLMSSENIWIDGAAVATLSGTVHSALRLLTLSGDAAHRKSLR